MRRALAIVVLLGMTGCASLLVTPEDTRSDKAAKYGARTVLGLATLGISEVEMGQIKKKQQRAAYIDGQYECMAAQKAKAERYAAEGNTEAAEMAVRFHNTCLNGLRHFYAREEAAYAAAARAA